MSAGLWTAFEAAAATGGALCARGGDPDRWIAEEWSAGGVSIDTRTLAPGEMFVALVDARDGHEFVINAFERGASAALVARAPQNAPDGAPLLVVGDTLEGLRDLARAARLRNFGKRIAVTGSVGKTYVAAVAMQLVAEGKLDLVVGGLTAKSPWASHAALTRPYVTVPGPGGAEEMHVMATPMGENAFLVTLETFLVEEAGR